MNRDRLIADERAQTEARILHHIVCELSGVRFAPEWRDEKGR